MKRCKTVWRVKPRPPTSLLPPPNHSLLRSSKLLPLPLREINKINCITLMMHHDSLELHLRSAGSSRYWIVTGFGHFPCLAELIYDLLNSRILCRKCAPKLWRFNICKQRENSRQSAVWTWTRHSYCRWMCNYMYFTRSEWRHSHRCFKRSTWRHSPYVFQTF